MPHRRALRAVWQNLAVVVLVLSAAANTFLFMKTREIAQDTKEAAQKTERVAQQTKGLALENRKRVAEIQRSRVQSCRQTYEGIREVFKPLFPPQPRTKEQQETLDTFNDTVDELKARCDIQTKP